MTRRTYFILYSCGLLVFSLVALLAKEPGYMDAEYYYAGSLQISRGFGMSEPYLWNYLQNPQSLPVPSFSYWMPLTSLVGSLGIVLTGVESFWASRIFILIMAGFIPVITARLTVYFINERSAGILAGLLAIFSGTYLPYFQTTDSFTPYMVLGGLLLLTIIKISKRKMPIVNYFLTGVITGLMHLCRADGLIVFIFIGFIFVMFIWKDHGKEKRILSVLTGGLIYFLGYLLIMAPWYVRNIVVFHSILPPGNGYLLWSTNYNDIFKAYPGTITFQKFFHEGVNRIFVVRLKALGENLKSLFAVNGSILLFPLMAVGMWKTRKEIITWLAAALILVNLITMSFVFPFAGYRGGFFHTNSSVQTALWALTPVGLMAFIDFGIRTRNWEYKRAWKGFSIILLIGVFSYSLYSVWRVAYSDLKSNVPWNGRLAQFQQIDASIVNVTGNKFANIMVNDPPGYYLATGRNAIVVPTDGLSAVLNMAERFQVRFLVMDNNNVEINEEMMNAGMENNSIRKIFETGETNVYEFIQE
jgi:hypothetical protein